MRLLLVVFVVIDDQHLLQLYSYQLDQRVVRIINICIRIIPIENIDNNSTNIEERNRDIMINDNSFPKVENKFSHFIDLRCLLAGIPVVFAEELDDKIEQTHTPLVMRIEKAPKTQSEQERQFVEKSTL